MKNPGPAKPKAVSMRRFINKTGAEQRMILEALFFMLVVRIIMRLMPFRVLQRVIQAQQTDEDEVALNDEHEKQLIASVAKIVQTVSRRVPWQSKCLVQAACARMMLNRRSIPSVLYLGVKKSQGDHLNPHAWLKTGNGVVLGDYHLEEYVVVSRLS